MAAAKLTGISPRLAFYHVSTGWAVGESQEKDSQDNRHLVLRGGGGEVEQLSQVFSSTTGIESKGFIFNYLHSQHRGTPDGALTVRLE